MTADETAELVRQLNAYTAAEYGGPRRWRHEAEHGWYGTGLFREGRKRKCRLTPIVSTRGTSYDQGMTDTLDATQWPEFMTVPEAARILRVSKMTVYRMIHRGDFDLGPDSGTVRIGRGFRIMAAALERVAKQGTSAV